MTYYVYCMKSSQLNTNPPIPKAVCSKQQTHASCKRTHALKQKSISPTTIVAAAWINWNKMVNFRYDSVRVKSKANAVHKLCVLEHKPFFSYHLDKSSSLLMWQICNDHGERVEKRTRNPLVRMQHINTVFCCSTFASVDRFSNILRKRTKDRKLAVYILVMQCTIWFV